MHLFVNLADICSRVKSILVHPKYSYYLYALIKSFFNLKYPIIPSNLGIISSYVSHLNEAYIAKDLHLLITITY